MASVLIPLAQGCEELEAVTLIDLLRRADIEVTTAGLDDQPVRGSRGTVLVPDTSLALALQQHFDMVVLPGGLPGADHLNEDPRIHKLLQDMAAADRYTAAICAAPKVLANAGILRGKQATSYPGVLASMQLDAVEIQDAAIVVDGKVITSRGPGTAMDFALSIIEILSGKSTRQTVEQALVR